MTIVYTIQVEQTDEMLYVLLNQVIYMKVLIFRSDASVLKYNTLRKEEQIKKKLRRDNTSEKDDYDCDDREPIYTIRKRMDAEKKCVTVDEDEHLRNCLTRRLKGIEANTIRNSLRVNSSETMNYIKNLIQFYLINFLFQM